MIRGHREGAGSVMSLFHSPLIYTFLCMPIFTTLHAPWRGSMQLAMEGEVWSRVSEPAKDLLRRLLAPRPSERITAKVRRVGGGGMQAQHPTCVVHLFNILYKL